MKKLLGISALALTVALSSVADAKKTNYYVRGDIGAAFSGKLADSNDKSSKSSKKDRLDKLNTAPVFGLGVGYRFNEMFRADLNGQFRSAKLNLSKNEENYNLKIKSLAVFANGYVDIPNSTILTPYLTAGVGLAQNSGDFKHTDSNNPNNNITFQAKKKFNFAWNAGLGARAKLNENVDLDFGYKYVNYGKMKFNPSKTQGGKSHPGAVIKNSIGSHQFLLGVAYNF